MYEFLTSAGSNVKIFFSHKGGRKQYKLGETLFPARPPKSTHCSLVVNGELVAKSVAAPLQEIVTNLPVGVDKKGAQSYYGKQLKHLIETPSGEVLAILKGDNFSRPRGRKESLAKALRMSNLTKADRTDIWKALNVGPAADEVAVEEENGATTKTMSAEERVDE